jgi:hypothetical protein
MKKSDLTPFEIELLECLRKYRATEFETVRDSKDVALLWQEADILLSKVPKFDDPNLRYTSQKYQDFLDFQARVYKWGETPRYIVDHKFVD